MHSSTPFLAGTLVVLGLLPAPGAVPVPASLEGDWILVEQTYGKGKANLADPDRPICLELFRDRERLSGRLRIGRDAAERWEWPAWVAEDRVLPVRPVAVAEGGPPGSLRLRYEVSPSSTDDLVLEVEEVYRLEEGGAALVGRIEVSFRRGGDRRGSYVLHRRFERIR